MECSEEIKKDPEAGAKWLVAEFGDRLFAVARRLGLNDYDAEDLVFRVLSQALAKIGTFDGKSSIYTWLYAIMMNFRRMDLRSRAANVLVPMAEVPESVDESPDPGEVLANISDADNVSFLLRPGTRRFCHLAPREDGLYLYTGLVILVR